MNRSAYLMTLLLVGALPVCGNAQPPRITLVDALALSHSTAEAAQMLIVLRPIPEVDSRDAAVTVSLTLLDDPNPYVSNVVEGRFKLPGLTKITVRPTSTQDDGTACLLVNVGQQEGEWCGLPVDDGRLSYAVSASATGSYPWGGDIPILVAQPLTATIFDRVSGKTISTFLINGIKLQGIISSYTGN
jgi:hypothetical protein